MYEKYFGFRERPFQLVPNPAYLYLSRSHEEALAHLNYAVSQGDGFVEITGEVGTGKTTLCRVFLNNLGDSAELAYIFNPMLDGHQLLKTIHDELGISSDADSIKELLDSLNLFLMQKKREGKKIILLIDEAQNLRSDVLEQLRLLSNLETDTSKLIQIILVGQPELREKLDSHELRQLSQRITLSCHLTPLTYKESKAYILHRIHIAAQKNGVGFSAGAFKCIYRYSGGIPRLINIACDRAMLTAYSLNKSRINSRIAGIAVRELAGRGEIRRTKEEWYKKRLFAITVITLMLIPAVLFWPLGAAWLNTGIFFPESRMSEKKSPEKEFLPDTDTRKKPRLPDSAGADVAVLPEKGQPEASEKSGAEIPQTEERKIPASAVSSAETAEKGDKKQKTVSPTAETQKSPLKVNESSPAETPQQIKEEKRRTDGSAQEKNAGDHAPVQKNEESIPKEKTDGAQAGSENLEAFLTSDRRISFSAPLRAAIRLWQSYAVAREPEPGEKAGDYFISGARQNSFSVISLENSPSLIQKLNLPAILEFRIPQSDEFCYLTLTKYNGERIDLQAGDLAFHAEPGIFSHYWTGRAFVLWKNYFGISGTIPRETTDESLIALKMLLRDIGFKGLENTAAYDRQTSEAVKMIQEKHGLKVDGSVGPHTKIVLYNELPNLKIPHIVQN